MNLIQDCVEYDGTATTSVCVRCKSTYYLNDGTCVIRNTNNQIANCSEFFNTNEKCKTCITGFRVTDDNKQCLPVINNCEIYEASSETSKELTCTRCTEGMTFNISTIQCEAGTVDKCLIYANNNSCY